MTTTAEPARTMPYISRRPAWADETRIEADSIVHGWTAPTVACVLNPGHEEVGTSPAPVEIYRYDDMLVFPNGDVTIEEGPWRIMVLDETFEDTQEARKLAAAILECCDRIEATSAAEDPA